MTLFNPNEQQEEEEEEQQEHHQRDDSVEIIITTTTTTQKVTPEQQQQQQHQQEILDAIELGEDGGGGDGDGDGDELKTNAQQQQQQQELSIIEDDAAAVAIQTSTISNNNSNNNNNNKYACSSNSYKKTAVGLVLLAFIIFVIADALTNKYVRTGILQFLEWIEGHPVAGVLSFILVYFLATICFVPGSVLTLGAGFVFSAALNNNDDDGSSSLWKGVLLGTCAVFVGASLGAIAAFLLGRYLFRDGCVGRLTQRYTVFAALDNALEKKGLRIMILLRLSPIVPFNALNYIAGVTGIKFWHYCLACFGMLPGTILYVFLGASAGSLAEIGGSGDTDGDGDTDTDTDTGTDGEAVEEELEENKTVTITVIVVGIVFGVLAVAVTSYYAKQELNKVLEDAEKEKEDEDDENENENENEDDEEAANNNLANDDNHDNNNNNSETAADELSSAQLS